MAVLATFCIVLPASFAALFNGLPIELMLMSRFCICPDWISSEVGAK